MMYIAPAIFAGQNNIVAGFSTRHGGVSPAPFDSLNLGLSTQDSQENVLRNRRRLFESVGFSLNTLAITGQVHGTELKYVEAPGLYPGYDAFVTDRTGMLLCLSAADCASVLIGDGTHNVVGACHAGWRGAVKGIVSKTIDAMLGIGAQSDALQAYISPCISLDRFEVGPEVAEQFDAAFVYNLPGRIKPHVDLKGAIRQQLVARGVSPDAIEVSPFCTYSETERFFSHRAEKGQTGRLMGFIGMRP